MKFLMTKPNLDIEDMTGLRLVGLRPARSGSDGIKEANSTFRFQIGKRLARTTCHNSGLTSGHFVVQA